jgi:hypothetical protein
MSMTEESPKKTLPVGLGLFLFTVFGLLIHSYIDSYSFRSDNSILSGIMQIVMSLALTAASLFVILRKDYGPKDKHWAYATIGTILGFWLRSGGK